jgi:hypothetical protein
MAARPQLKLARLTAFPGHPGRPAARDNLPLQVERHPIVRPASRAAMPLKAHFLGIVGAEFVAEELAVWSAPRLHITVHDREQFAAECTACRHIDVASEYAHNSLQMLRRLFSADAYGRQRTSVAVPTGGRLPVRPQRHNMVGLTAKLRKRHIVEIRANITRTWRRRIRRNRRGEVAECAYGNRRLPASKLHLGAKPSRTLPAIVGARRRSEIGIRHHPFLHRGVHGSDCRRQPGESGWATALRHWEALS